MMRTANPGDRQRVDPQVLGLMAILVLAMGWWIYSTVRHFQAMDQMSEARTMRHDVQSLFFWSMQQNGNDVMKACSFDAIQRVPQSENFRNAHRILQLNPKLRLNTQLRRQGKYVESLEVHPTPDRQGCVTTIHFRKDESVSDDLAGKFYSSRYDIQTERHHCTTDIRKRALVKGCRRR